MIAVHELFWVGGAFLLVMVLAQSFIAVLGSLQQLARKRQQKTNEAEFFQLRVEKARWSLVQDITTSRSWAGWRKFEVESKQVENKNGDICSFYLRPHDRKPLADYKPGQFLTVRVSLAGSKQPVVRCYSLSQAPTSDHYRLTIKRVASPPNQAGLPPGVVSGFLHDHLAAGDIVDVKTPAGQFFLDAESSRPVVLIGGGIGVTPMISMVNHIAREDPDCETWLFYGVRCEDELIFSHHLDELVLRHPHIHVHYCLSEVPEKQLRKRKEHHAGRISIEFLRRQLQVSNYQFYLCGPGPMMQALHQGLVDWGVPDNDIHAEKFGPGAIRKQKPTVNPDASGAKVTFRKTGKSVPWDAGMPHLWEFAFANDVEIESGCLEGNCGTCQTAIISGEVSYTKDPGYACEDGTCLPCCCTPKGSLELDA